MEYTAYQLLWFFLIYSVAGWAIGTAGAAVREKKFVDVGFLYGPICPAYGFGALAFALFLPELKNQIFFLFLGGVILSAAVAFFTGFVLERIFHRKWWDYSRRRLQFEGYVSLPYSIVWGLAAVLCIWFVNPLLDRLITLIPKNLGNIFLTVFYSILAVDLFGSVIGILSLHFRIKNARLDLVEEVSEGLQKAADQLGAGVAGWVQKRVSRAYPHLAAKELVKAQLEAQRKKDLAREKAGVFAAGCGFYKLFWLFFLGSLVGDITETIFCLATTGVLMSRSSLVYGPFSIVWGFGCALLTAILYKYKDRSDHFIFITGTVLGGAYEYMCSVATELVFGTVFWDYSAIPFNLGGRINLLYCFFWGIAAVVWLKLLYPVFSRWIERIPKKVGVPLTWVLVVFMVVNMALSALALARYTERQTASEPSSTAIGRFLDDHFDDARMERIYPNAILVE